MKKLLSLLASGLLLASLSACATAPNSAADRAEFDATNDPLEPANRVVFEFNQVVDKIFLRPAAWVYREVMPDFAQDVVHNILQNAGEPVTFMNAILQGRVTDAGTSFNRFIVNSIAGVGGIADLASEGKLKKVDADFGQTLHVWGVPSGPYLVLPVLGPSNPRDAIGFAVDSMAEPWGYVTYGLSGAGTRNRYTAANLGATMLDRRSKAIDALDALEKGSVDFYAQLRSVSRQYRNKQLGISSTPSSSIHEMNDDGSVEKKPTKKRKRKAKKAPASLAAEPSASSTSPAPSAETPASVSPAPASVQ